MSELACNFEGVSILCLCEGGAETAIMDILLDADCLLFNRSDLLKEKCS